MSCKAIAWAFDQRTERPEDKLILIHLANNSGMDGGVTFTAPLDFAQIGRFTGLSKDEVKRSFDRLLGCELVRRVSKTWCQLSCSDSKTGFADLSHWEDAA